MDSTLERLRKELRRFQEESVETSAKATASCARVVKKQKEYDLFIMNFNQKLRYDLDLKNEELAAEEIAEAAKVTVEMDTEDVLSWLAETDGFILGLDADGQIPQ
jgi:tRNA U34 5-carboxymethylaminomethyl modifying GTPase MnmE/TrmE